MGLQDALNKIVSDEINDFESFVDAYLVLEGMQATQKEDIDRMKLDRVLILDPDSKASWLIKQVNNSHIKELKENITNKIRELGCIPDIDNLGSFGSSGAAIKFKLISTEIQASQQERVLQKGLQRRIELLYNILRITDPAIGNYTDVIITFERNFIMLTDDKIKEAQLDAQLVTDEIISKEYFLMKHKNLTLKEAWEELKKIDLVNFAIADKTYPLENNEEDL
jgi:SPP1 family phage portal protein